MLCAAALTGAIIAAATGPARSDYVQFATTESYLAATESVRDGYIAGLIDALYAFELAPAGLDDCVSVMRLREIRTSFDGWLRNHPGEWAFSLPSNFVAAVDDLCR